LSLFRLAAPFFGLAALGVVYARGGLIMLSALTTQSAVGLYTVVDRFMVAAALVPGTFNSAVYPALSRLARTSAVDAMDLVVRCLRLVTVGTIPLAALLTIFASDIIDLIFGPQFLAATIALQVLAWTLPLRGVQWLLGSQLAAMDQQSALARARTVSLCAFLTLTPLLILGVGFVGAAWAVLICDGLQLGLYWRLLKSKESAPALSKRLIAPMLAAMATLGASTMLLHLSLPLRVLGVCLVMGISLWASGAIRRQDLVFLRSLVNSRERSPDQPRS